MKIILLAGQSILNKEWIEEVEGEFNKEFPNTSVIYYDHWDSGSKDVNIEIETSKLLNMVDECDGEYMVFAKSIGTVVFYNSLKNLTKMPKGVLMVGIPYDSALGMGFDMEKLRDMVDFSINIYQKELDPFGKLEDIRRLEGGKVKVNEYVCTDEGNDNHHYANTKYLLELIRGLG